MERHASRGTGGKAPTADPAAAGVDPAEFAEYLRAERERRRLTLDQVADETKIASRHLAALERGDVRNWPGGMYRRAMMRAYAESIGVDREYALKQFEQAFAAPPPQPEMPAPPPPATASLPRWRPSRRQLLASGASLLAVAAVVIAWDFAGSLMRADSDIPPAALVEPAAPTAQPAPTAQRGASAPAPTPKPSQPAIVNASVPNSVATSGVARTRSTEPQPLATEGTLVVASQPAGARVTVNGIGWGETPLTIKHIEFGQKRVRLTMQGYVSQERVVNLGPAAPQGNLQFTLTNRK
jgi:cytoskeleton protein RodZ